jgi:hypothetical protein
MNIHIRLDPHGRGDIFWVASDQTGAGATVYGNDPYDLASIDQNGEQELRRLLNIARNNNWNAYAIPTEEFARNISAAFIALQPSFGRIFNDSPSFHIPEPLRNALNITQEVVTISEWLNRYPAS